MSHFVEGDVVVLKSGGPRMTVENPSWNDGTEVRVVWFGEDLVMLRQEAFKPSLLRKVEPPQDDRHF